MPRIIHTAIMIFIACACAGCGPDQATQLAGHRDAPPKQRSDVAPDVLRSGLVAMQPRIKRMVNGYSKIEPNAQFRYFMHPAPDRDAVIEFNVAGLSEVTLSPRIAALDPECSKDPQAGQVALTYAIDGNRVARVVVDRNYDQSIPIELQKAKTLTVSVNQDNGVITCDWFSLGFSQVK